MSNCNHFNSTVIIKAKTYVCDECIKTGDSWVQLRTCQTCGGTHCCDSSPNKHAAKHYHNSKHPVIVSAEPGETWAWSYEDEVFMKY